MTEFQGTSTARLALAIAFLYTVRFCHGNLCGARWGTALLVQQNLLKMDFLDGFTWELFCSRGDGLRKQTTGVCSTLFLTAKKIAHLGTVQCKVRGVCAVQTIRELFCTGLTVFLVSVQGWEEMLVLARQEK